MQQDSSDKIAGKTISGGGVIINARGEVLVVSQRGDSWSLPKGHVDPGETDLQAAYREIREEAGIEKEALEYMGPLGAYERYRIGKGGVGEDPSSVKEIRMFLFKTNQETLQPTDPENPEARWIPANEVADLLTHQKDKEFFLKVLPRIKTECGV